MRFDLGTLDSGERLLPFGLLVSFSWGILLKFRQVDQIEAPLTNLNPLSKIPGSAPGQSLLWQSPRITSATVNQIIQPIDHFLRVPSVFGL